MDAHAYTCEECGDVEILTREEFAQLADVPFKGSGKAHRKYGKKFICSSCKAPPSVSKRGTGKVGIRTGTIRELSQHPLTGKRRAAFSAVRRHDFPPSATLNLSPDERQSYGVIVTIREQTTRETFVLVGHGPVRAALTEVVEKAEWLAGDWKVSTICTPATIYGDMQGWRTDHTTPEARMLAGIGRQDMCEPARPKPFMVDRQRGLR